MHKVMVVLDAATGNVPNAMRFRCHAGRSRGRGGAVTTP